MSLKEIEASIEGLSVADRRKLTAFLVALRHRDLADYRKKMAEKIDDSSSANWVTLEELDRRIES